MFRQTINWFLAATLVLMSPAYSLTDSAAPTKIQIPFANSAGGAYVRTVPIASQIGIQNGAASYTDGFPPLNFTPINAGGVPPFGQDMNGILRDVSAHARWWAAGGPVYYDGTYQTNIGGYPKGAIVQSAITTGLLWVSTADNNVANPDTGGAGWSHVNSTVYAPLTGTGASGTWGISITGDAAVANSLSAGATATTQPANDSSTKVATTAYVDRTNDYQAFTVSGTWIKPAGLAPSALVQIQAWAGGGGGSVVSQDGGGGGGYSSIIVYASQLNATESVIVGLGGPAGNPGTNGGNSTFAGIVTAYGGAGGKSGSGGGGGGGTGGAGGYGCVAGASGVVASANGFAINEAGGSTNGSVPQGRASMYGGGCGGQTGSGYAGGSWFGGGGGSADGAPSGGIGYWGGAGGATGGTGVAPAGGGGSGAAGARGEVRVRVF